MILPKISLTPSGRPQLLPSEIERLLLDKVDLEFEGVGGTEGCQTADRYQNGYVVVTSHRLIWIDTAATPSPGRSCCLPLESIHSTHKRVQYGINLINPKVRLEVKVYVDLKSQPCNMQTSATFRYLQLRCRGEGPDTFNEHLNAAIQALRQQQEQQQRRQQQQAALQQQQQQQQTIVLAWGSGSVHGNRLSAPSGYSASTGPGQANYSAGSGRLSSPADHFQGVTPWQSRPAAAAALSPTVQQTQAVDKDLFETLLDMGFPRTRVLRALLATHSEHMQAALDWILAAGEDPAMDAALPGPEPVQVGRQELQQLQQLAMQQLPPSAAGQLHLPGLATGSTSSPAAASGGGSSRSWAGSLAPAVAAGGGVPGAGGSSMLYNSASGPAGYGQFTAAGPQQQQQQQQQQPGPGSRIIGVAGIMQREAEKTSQASANLAVAFQDLDNLMGMAAEMVKLAEKFRGVMGPDGKITLNPGGGSPGSSDDAAAAAVAGGDLLLDADTQLQLIAMGIASPVTKASAGARYHQELSRQLADFLAAPLAKAGGVMMLPDVYCLFNRARGSELVSPDDLMQACEAFQQVGLPLRLRKFPSGVIVVQGSQFSDTQLCRNIEQLLQKLIAQQQHETAAAVAGAPPLGPPVASTDVSAALSLPLALAKEALLVAEAHGVLCRDDGTEGLRFFRNFFKEAQPLAV